MNDRIAASAISFAFSSVFFFTNHEVTLDTTVVGEVVVCSACGAELEVVATDPPQLALAPEIQEDYGE